MKFQEVLQELKVPFLTSGEHHHCRENWLQLDCPYCSKNSGHYRLGYSLSHNRFNCWFCGKVRLLPTLVEVSGASYRRCKELLDGLELSYLPEKVEHTGKLQIPTGVSPMGYAHKEYLKGRGLDPAEVEKVWGVKGIGLGVHLKWCLWIPITYKRELVSWTTRSVSDKGKRYQNAPVESESVSAKNILYGADLTQQSVIVVEGPVDVWRIGPGAVATMGIGFNQQQLLKIAKYPKRIICFDNEPEAQNKAEQLCSSLSVLPGITLKVQLDAKDAADSSDKDIELLRKMIK